MLHSIKLSAYCIASLFLCCASARGEAAPATQPSSSDTFIVSDMRVQTIAGFTFLYDTSQTTLEKIGEPIGKTLPALEKAIADGKFHPVGSPAFIYREMKDISQPF